MDTVTPADRATLLRLLDQAALALAGGPRNLVDHVTATRNLLEQHLPTDDHQEQPCPPLAPSN